MRQSIEVDIDEASPEPQKMSRQMIPGEEYCFACWRSVQKKSWLDIEVCGEDEISTLRKEVAATEAEAEQLRKQLARQPANWLYPAGRFAHVFTKLHAFPRSEDDGSSDSLE